jgi:REP element-mobilizing transposase RayT
MYSEMKQAPVVLDDLQRRLVTEAINEVCEFRRYSLNAVNVRSNHAHIVVSASVKPEKVVNDLKAYATRKLRQHLLLPDRKLWSRGASTRYLWKPRHVTAAIDYVLYCQEDIPFEFREG